MERTITFACRDLFGPGECACAAHHNVLVLTGVVYAIVACDRVHACGLTVSNGMLALVAGTTALYHATHAHAACVLDRIVVRACCAMAFLYVLKGKCTSPRGALVATLLVVALNYSPLTYCVQGHALMHLAGLGAYACIGATT